MKRPKPITPYERLLRKARAFATDALYPMRRTMWFYPANRITEEWRLGDLAQRVRAADQLGWDVRLRWEDRGLVVEYVKRITAEAV